MNKNYLLTLIGSLVFMFLFTSATAPSIKKEEKNSKDFVRKVETPLNLVVEDKSSAKSLNNKELKKIAENVKGEKLTFKEKVALKVFGKKIQTISKHDKKTANKGEKSQTVALILAVFLGGLGIHRFYLGYTWQGIVQLLTGGGCGIWAIIDIVRIVMGTLKPNGKPYDKTFDI
ncbi:TM2 domain-containing protein [Hugenholtzia roseola]|uniref:TM2 domain-containing protein n=1 Tax=Hugenholtzia roseola TaxID=1002 RepID=UPI001B7F7D3A|nr:TM2 domain-containing protein [Hugenholtzia roseola]